MPLKRFRTLIVSIIVLSFVAILIIFPVLQVYKFENILRATVQPLKGENIFFIDSREATADVKLMTRQACAIESAALTNPNLKVFVLFSCPERLRNLQMTPELKSVMTYPNVFIYYLDVKEFSASTPMEEFIRSKKLAKSNFKIEHTSDVLRLLVLWKYGGTYLDTDMIVKKSFEAVKPNFACVQDEFYVNGAILSFDQMKGKHLSSLFMEALVKNFDGENFASNGPVMITDVLKGLCAVENVTQMVMKSDCNGFHVLPSDNCYSVPYNWWEDLMTEDNADQVMSRINDSIVVHFWNNLSHGKLVSVTSQAPYAQLARKFCPKVIKNVAEFF